MTSIPDYSVFPFKTKLLKRRLTYVEKLKAEEKQIKKILREGNKILDRRFYEDVDDVYPTFTPPVHNPKSLIAKAAAIESGQIPMVTPLLPDLDWSTISDPAVREKLQGYHRNQNREIEILNIIMHLPDKKQLYDDEYREALSRRVNIEDAELRKARLQYIHRQNTVYAYENALRKRLHELQREFDRLERTKYESDFE